jgi:hypothetical protein
MPVEVPETPLEIRRRAFYEWLRSEVFTDFSGSDEINDVLVNDDVITQVVVHYFNKAILDKELESYETDDGQMHFRMTRRLRIN